MSASHARHRYHGDAFNDEHAADVLALCALNREGSIDIGHESTAILGMVSIYLRRRAGYAVADYSQVRSSLCFSVRRMGMRMPLSRTNNSSCPALLNDYPHEFFVQSQESSPNQLFDDTRTARWLEAQQTISVRQSQR
jgi:hypothetical protein